MKEADTELSWSTRWSIKQWKARQKEFPRKHWLQKVQKRRENLYKVNALSRKERKVAEKSYWLKFVKPSNYCLYSNKCSGKNINTKVLRCYTAPQQMTACHTFMVSVFKNQSIK